MREQDERGEHDGVPSASDAGDCAGTPYDPAAPDTSAEENPATGPSHTVPIGRPVNDESYARLKRDAERGAPLRRRNIQEDR